MAPNDFGFYTQRPSFYRVLTEAMRDMDEHGFDSAERVQGWIRRIRDAALSSMIPERIVEEQLQETFRGAYKRLVEQGGILKHHPGVSRFTIDKVKPRLRAELDRRLMASRELIKLNRASAIERTTQRFSGWATSIPIGGTDVTDKAEVKTAVRKALVQLPFEERRVAIDQGHKFVSNLNSIIASDSGALAMIWHSHWRQKNYAFREDHKERDDKLYVVRGNWALNAGFMTPAGHLFTDEITAPAEEPFCRCFGQYVYSLRSLPPDMVTNKGRAELQRLKAMVAA